MTKPKLEPTPAPWNVKTLEDGKTVIVAVDGYGNTLRLICQMPLDKDWPDSTNNAHYIVSLVNGAVPTPPPELSGNTGDLKQTKQPLSYQEVLQKVFHPTPDQDELNYWHNKCDQLESQLEDYRKALEWLAKSYYVIGYKNISQIFTCNTHSIEDGEFEWYFEGKTALEAIQNAMKKEGESRNE